MRIAAIGVALFLSVIGLLDAQVPFVRIAPGMLQFGARTELVAIDANVPCRQVASLCDIHYAFKPETSMVVWSSIRNESAVPITIDGVPEAYFKQFFIESMVRPVAAYDGGDGLEGVDIATAKPLRSVVLGPSDERVIGIEFRTTRETAQACASNQSGTGLAWDRVPLAWHWAFIRHETQLSFNRSVIVMAPEDEDCPN